MEGEDGTLDLTASGLLAAIYVLNSTISSRTDTHVLYTSYIYCTLNINMFRHMPVPRDTSGLREIIIVCFESVRNFQTLS